MKSKAADKELYKLKTGQNKLDMGQNKLEAEVSEIKERLGSMESGISEILDIMKRNRS